MNCTFTNQSIELCHERPGAPAASPPRSGRTSRGPRASSRASWRARGRSSHQQIASTVCSGPNVFHHQQRWDSGRADRVQVSSRVRGIGPGVLPEVPRQLVRRDHQKPRDPFRLVGFAQTSTSGYPSSAAAERISTDRQRSSAARAPNARQRRCRDCRCRQQSVRRGDAPAGRMSATSARAQPRATVRRRPPPSR